MNGSPYADRARSHRARLNKNFRILFTKKKTAAAGSAFPDFGVHEGAPRQRRCPLVSWTTNKKTRSVAKLWGARGGVAPHIVKTEENFWEREGCAPSYREN
jgi:hypothetical protein